MKFQFSAIEDGVTYTQNFDTEYLDKVIEHFDSFVRGCGFCPKGEITTAEVTRQEDFAQSFFNEG